MNVSRRALVAGSALLPALPGLARAQGAWPQRPVRIIVPYAASGGTDLLTRALGEAMRPAIGQPVVVENRAGAAGVIGTEVVARSEPDGYSLCAVVSTHVMNKHTMDRLPYDPIRDFTPIAILTRNTMVLCAGASQPFSDVRGMIEQARANPGRIGTGSTEALSSFIGQEVARRARIEMPDVAYRSGGQLMNDVVAGHLPTGWTSTASATPHIPTGRVKVLAASTATRTPFFPDAPTMQEAGMADFDYAGWVWLLGPAGMQQPVVDRIHAAVSTAFGDEAFRTRLSAMGIEPALKPGPDLLALMQREDRTWAAAAAAGNLQRTN